MEFQSSLEAFFLKSVWGVLVLGACGSILGGIIIFLLKKLYIYASSKRELFFMSFMYKYYREHEISEKFVDEHGPSIDAKIVVYAVGRWVEAVLYFLILGLIVLLTSIVGIFYGLERRYLLSCLIAMTLISLHYFIKVAASSVGCMDYEMHSSYEEIRSQQPKSFNIWVEKNKKQGV